jgi:hypothetical protein
MQVLEPIDQTYLTGFAQVYDLAYVWRGGKWIDDNSVVGSGSKVIPIYDLDKVPYLDQLYRFKEPTYVARYYWGAARKWVFFGSNKNY